MKSSAPVLVAALAISGALGCSSIPGMPTQGTGSGFSLATVDYVNQTREEVTAQVLAELPDRVETLLVEDRRRISQLQENVLEQQEELEALEAGVARSNSDLADAVLSLEAQSEAYRSGTDALEETREQLERSMASLPTEILVLLRDAVDRHLEATGAGRQAAADAQEEPGSEFADERAPGIDFAEAPESEPAPQ